MRCSGIFNKYFAAKFTGEYESEKILTIGWDVTDLQKWGWYLPFWNTVYNILIFRVYWLLFFQDK